MSFNIRKASIQRVFEAAIKYVRSTTNDLGTGIAFDGEVFDVESLPPKAIRKAELIRTLDATEGKVWNEHLDALNREERPAKLREVFEPHFQAIAQQFGLTYKPVGTTLRA